MAFDSTTRNLVESHYHQGKTAKQIYEILARNVSIQTIRRWINVLSRKNRYLARNHLVGPEPCEQGNWPKRSREASKLAYARKAPNCWPETTTVATAPSAESSTMI